MYCTFGRRVNTDVPQSFWQGSLYWRLFVGLINKSKSSENKETSYNEYRVRGVTINNRMRLLSLSLSLSIGLQWGCTLYLVYTDEQLNLGLAWVGLLSNGGSIQCK